MHKTKYVRIQGIDLSYRTQKPVCIFSLGWRLIRNKVFNSEEEQLFVEIDKWFKKYLPEPPFYKDDNSIGAITYFKGESTEEMFKRLIPVMDLFNKHNVAFDIVYTNYVGNIIYEDEYQIGVIKE
jgi:hypothetical protein